MIKANSGLGKMVLTTALAVLFFTAFTAAVASADTITVCSSGCDYTTIQAAVNAASSGDTVYVYNGSYTENVDIWTASLTLQGEGADVVTVTAASSSDHVFHVTEDWVNISGFTMTGATERGKAGIYLCSGIYQCNIYDNHASWNYYSIHLQSSSSNTMQNNTANSNHHGIYLNSSSNNTMQNNTASSNNVHGILLSHSSNHNTLANNTANSNHWYGIYLHYLSNYNTLENNTANDNIGTHGNGIYLHHSSNHNTLTNNSANSNSNNGICLWYLSNYNTLTNNTASNNDYGIRLYNSSNNLIYNNYFNNTVNAYDNGWNIWNITKTSGTNIIGGSYLGGNYWSDYAGADTDGDGLGDTPYDIPGGTNKDYLPLVAPKPTVSITTDKYEYAPGDTMITTISLKNPTADSINTYFIWYFGLPDYGYWTPIMTLPLSLPAGFDESYDIPLYIGNLGPYSFNATFFVALLNTTTYEFIDWDTANWRYVPSKSKKAQEEMTPSEIAEEISRAIERVELPSEIVQGETMPVEIAKEIMKIVKE